MCGLVGRAGPLETQDEKVFKILLLLDYLRGQDSTGVASISKQNKVDIVKVGDDPIILFNSQDYDSTVVGLVDAIWIGHNRSATIGATTRANAHPFKCDHIIGVHNGTLDKSSLATLESRMDIMYGTDSETIFQHMAIYGVEDTVKRLQGAWALVWYDSDQKTLNMLKNDKRPLYTCETTRGDKKFLTWASEFNMIQAARAMSDKSDGTLYLDDNGYGYFPLPNDTLHTWSLEQILTGDLKPKLRAMAGIPSPTVITYKPTLFSAGEATPPKTESFHLVKDKYETKEVILENNGLILGVFEQSEWEEITRFGCSCCGQDVDPEMHGLIIYTNEGTVICPDCSEESITIVYNSGSPLITERILG